MSPTANLPPWWGFALALVGLAVIWFWLPAGHAWFGLLLVGGALVVANATHPLTAPGGALAFLPTAKGV